LQGWATSERGVRAWVEKMILIKSFTGEKSSNTIIPVDRYFFQRPINSGGGYWLGRTFDFVFMIEIPRPVSLREVIMYLQNYARESSDPSDNIDEFHLQ